MENNKLTEQAITWIKQMIHDDDDDADTMPMIEKVRFLRIVLKTTGINIGQVYKDPDIFNWIKQNNNAVFEACRELDKEKQYAEN